MDKEQMKLIFDLCDADRKGFICSGDLMRFSSLCQQQQQQEHLSPNQSDDDMGKILELLSINETDQLDFEKFCARVSRALEKYPSSPDLVRFSRQSPEGNDKTTFEGSGQKTSKAKDKNEFSKAARRSLFGAPESLDNIHKSVHTVNNSTPSSEDFQKALFRFQRQIDEIKELQIDTKVDVLSLLEQQSKRIEIEIARQTSQLQSVTEIRIKDERKHIQDMIAMEESEWRVRLEKIQDEKLLMSSEIEGLKERVQDLEQELDKKENALERLEVENHNFVHRMQSLEQDQISSSARSREKDGTIEFLKQKVENLQEEITSNNSNLTSMKLKLECECQRLDEDRLALNFDRVTIAQDREQLKRQLEQVNETITTLIQVKPILNPLKHLKTNEDSMLDPDIDVALEMFEDEDMNRANLEHLVEENKLLRTKLEQVTKVKQELEQTMTTLKQEKEEMKKNIANLKKYKNEDSQNLISQFKKSIPMFEMKPRIRELEKQACEEKQRYEMLKKKSGNDKEILERALDISRLKVSECEEKIQNLKQELEERKTELSCLKDFAQIYHLNSEEKRGFSIMLDDLKIQMEIVFKRLAEVEKIVVRN